MPESNINNVWVVAYIDSTQLHRVSNELTKYPEYADVKAYIPTIKILKKTFKKEDIFEDIPLLFNYGFFSIPRKFAVYKNYLDQMQKNISCIYSWVKDPTKDPVHHADEEEHSIKRPIYYAEASAKEIAELVKSALNIGAHSAEDLDLLKPGEIITLRGYPFDGLSAELLEVDKKKHKVRVKLLIFNQMKEVNVNYENVFFTIYHSHNADDIGNTANSLDAMADKKILDKFIHKNTKK